MANSTRVRPGGNDRRRGGGRSRNQGSSSMILWLEIGGAALVGVVLIAIFFRGTSETPPRTDSVPEVSREVPVPAPPPAPAANPAPRPSPAPARAQERPRRREQVPPARPAPAVDLTVGRELYGRAQKLWDEGTELHKQGKAGQWRDKLHEAYVLLGEALDSVGEFNLWDEEADLKNWQVDPQSLAAKKQIATWFSLQSRIHKVLPKRSQ